MSSPPPPSSSSVRSHPPGAGAPPPRSSARYASAAAAAAPGTPKPSLRARAARFFARDGPGGLTFGAWAAMAAAAVFIAAATWHDSRLQEKRREAERELVTSSSEDWRNAKQEARDAARDARSAASKWSKGQ